MIAAAINVNPRWFWHGPGRLIKRGPLGTPLLLFGCKAPAGFAEVPLAQRPQ
jgi:hypothetical protein